MITVSNVLQHRVKNIHHHYGRPPEANSALPAFVAAHHVLTHTLGIDTVTKAAIATGVPRPQIDNALTILRSDNVKLVSQVLNGFETLHHAAKSVRARVKLIDTFKQATPADRIALCQAAGPDVVFDTLVAAL